MAIPGKESENGVYEFPYMIKPVQKTKWETIKTGIWDPSTKEFLGRTAKSWRKFFFDFLKNIAYRFFIFLVVRFRDL